MVFHRISSPFIRNCLVPTFYYAAIIVAVALAMFGLLFVKQELLNEHSPIITGISIPGQSVSSSPEPVRTSVSKAKPGEDEYYFIDEKLNAKVTVNKTAFKSRTCDRITGRRILMNYAERCCKSSQPKNCETGLAHGFDICLSFTQNSVDDWFVQHNSRVFAAITMAGYGIWKSFLSTILFAPFIFKLNFFKFQKVMKILMTLEDNDVLFYSDSGAKWLDSAEDYFCLMDERNQDVVVFSVGLPENEYTKGDAFLVADCTERNCTHSQQRLGGYSMYRKSMRAFHFLSTWLTFNQDLRIVSDESSRLRKDMDHFKANRHDQTALSLASKRCGLPEWPDPSQFGQDGYNKMLREKPEFKTIAKTIIDCTRDKS